MRRSMHLVILIGLDIMFRNGAVSVCNTWCEADYNGGKNQGRHCAPGDMAFFVWWVFFLWDCKPHAIANPTGR